MSFYCESLPFLSDFFLKNAYIDMYRHFTSPRFNLFPLISTVMRNRFAFPLTLDCTPIEEVEISPKLRRSHMASLLAAIQYIYVNPEWNQRIFKLLDDHISKDKKATGRKGMSLWEIFVLGQVRLCMNISYDELCYLANDSGSLRGILGVMPTNFTLGHHYEYQNIYDNVSLLDDQILRQINDVIVELGHEVFKKKKRRICA